MQSICLINIKIKLWYFLYISGVLALLASAANLWGAPLQSDEDVQRRNLMEDWDGYEAHGVGPTPAVPPLPPYTPSAHPTFAPPVLGAQQYFPFDDLSILPPPPPYTPWKNLYLWVSITWSANKFSIVLILISSNVGQSFYLKITSQLKITINYVNNGHIIIIFLCMVLIQIDLLKLYISKYLYLYWWNMCVLSISYLFRTFIELFFI